jgi:hypothetical protein
VEDIQNIVCDVIKATSVDYRPELDELTKALSSKASKNEVA